MCSGAHVTQMDSHPSAIGAFLEGVLHCKPQPPVRSCVLKVLSLSPSFPLFLCAWHSYHFSLYFTVSRQDSQFLARQCSTAGRQSSQWRGAAEGGAKRAASLQWALLRATAGPLQAGTILEICNTLINVLKFFTSLDHYLSQETLDSLSDLYTALNEEDMWAGLWTLRCKFPRTATAISFESQGLFEQVNVYARLHSELTFYKYISKPSVGVRLKRHTREPSSKPGTSTTWPPPHPPSCPSTRRGRSIGATVLRSWGSGTPSMTLGRVRMEPTPSWVSGEPAYEPI